MMENRWDGQEGTWRTQDPHRIIAPIKNKLAVWIFCFHVDNFIDSEVLIRDGQSVELETFPSVLLSLFMKYKIFYLAIFHIFENWFTTFFALCFLGVRIQINKLNLRNPSLSAWSVLTAVAGNERSTTVKNSSEWPPRHLTSCPSLSCPPTDGKIKIICPYQAQRMSEIWAAVSMFWNFSCLYYHVILLMLRIINAYMASISIRTCSLFLFCMSSWKVLRVSDFYASVLLGNGTYTELTQQTNSL
jgi:hypothetical protein